jgi:hypothetical protein
MELFGYLENRISKVHNTTTYANILPQILSAATAAGSDGISFFTYHANIHDPGRKPSKDIDRAREAVVDGIAAFDRIWQNVSREPSPLAFYYPYEDWVIERWTTSYLPAIDAFRVLGAAEGTKVPRREVVVRNAAGNRIRVGARFGLQAGREWTGWKPLGAKVGLWTDLVTGAIKPGRASDGGLAVAVPSRGYVCWEFKEN